MLLHSQKQVQNTDSFSTTPSYVQNWEIQPSILWMLNGRIITFLPTSTPLLHSRFPFWCLNFILVQFFNNPSYGSKTWHFINWEILGGITRYWHFVQAFFDVCFWITYNTYRKEFERNFTLTDHSRIFFRQTFVLSTLMNTVCLINSKMLIIGRLSSSMGSSQREVKLPSPSSRSSLPIVRRVSRSRFLENMCRFNFANLNLTRKRMKRDSISRNASNS